MKMDYFEYSYSNRIKNQNIILLLRCSSAAVDNPRSFNLQLPAICSSSSARRAARNPGLDGKCSLSRVSSGYTRGSPPTRTCPDHLICLSQMPEESQLAQ